MKKPGLVVDARMINSSGIGTYLKNILPQVSKYFNLTLLGNRDELQLFEWTKDLKIIEFNSKIYSLKEQLLYPFKIPKTNLYWCPHFNAPIFPTRAKKLLTTIYDVNHLANKENNSKLKWLYAKLLYNNAISRSEKIITISDFSKSELLHYTNLNEEKLNIIYCGVDLDRFKKNDDRINKKIPNKYILYVGNVKPHKNLITLLKGYKALPNHIKNTYKLVILGRKEGFITPDFQISRFINDNNLMKHLHFTGYIEDNIVPYIYKKASLFVFPSLYEGFGLPILEAMACEVPVLTSNATSLPEVGGEAVIYFNPKDPNEIAEKIMTIISNDELKKDLIKKGNIQVNFFSWNVAGKKHIKVITKLLN